MQLSDKDQRLVNRALAVLEHAMKYTVDRDPMTNPTAVRGFLALRFAGLEREEFHVMYLDSQNRMIECEREFAGTLTQASVYPREIVKNALRHNASAVILAHNHPSGTEVPSAGDRTLTSALQSALNLVDVRVLDHIIAAGHRTYSFAEAGIL